MQQYDAIIIGIGQAGNPLTKALTEQGLKVAVIEKKFAGGSCINYGCSPTKAMLASAGVAHLAKNASQWGIKVASSEANFKQVIKRRNSIFKSWRKGIDKRINENEGAELIYGEAKFTSNNTVSVTLNEGGTLELNSPKTFINVGTTPAVPNIEGLADVKYYTAKSIMKLKQLPKHLVILGGSYIGIEYAQMYRRLGSKVTLLHNEDQLLNREDKDIALAIHKILEQEKIKIHLKAGTKVIKQGKNGLTLTCKLPGLQKDKKIRATHLLIATGTTPSTKALDLATAGIKTDAKGYIQVNDKLETSVKGVWALGDCKGGPEFTHISYDDYRVVENQLFGDKLKTTKGRPVPYTLYTQPELGRIGLTEKEATDAKKTFIVAKLDAKDIGRATLEGKEEGVLKVLIDKETGHLLGGACLVDRGGELAAMLQVAMLGNLTYQQLRDGIFAHPGYAEVWNTLFADI